LTLTIPKLIINIVTTEQGPVDTNDYIELNRLVTEIAWRIDHDQADTVWELFIPAGSLNTSGAPLQGHDAIREWGRERVNSSVKTRHICSSMRFTYSGADKATGSTLLTVFMGEKDVIGLPVPKVVGEDYDSFIRTHDGWKFSSRTFETLFASS
jgi:hypothetical protein